MATSKLSVRAAIELYERIMTHPEAPPRDNAHVEAVRNAEIRLREVKARYGDIIRDATAEVKNAKVRAGRALAHQWTDLLEEEP